MGVDVLLIKMQKTFSLVGMPTPFFAEVSTRDYMSMNCTLDAKKNCKLLELMMEKHGFKGLETEWWHFDFPSKNTMLSIRY